MAHVVLKKQPCQLKYFINRSISIHPNILTTIKNTDTVVIELSSENLSAEDRVGLPTQVIIHMNGKDFLNKATRMNDQYYIVRCQD